MESGTIARWNLEEGQAFAAGDVFCEVETDKATVDFEAQDDGVLVKILRDAGSSEIKCGEPIMVTIEEEDDLDAFKDFKLEAAATEAPAEPESAAPPVAPAPAPTPTTPSAPPAVSKPPTSTGGRVIASPLAHMLSKELGYDISTITGTGPGGRIIAADVKEFIPPAASEATGVSAPATTEAPVAEAIPEPIVGAGYTDYPLTTNAREIASRLAASKTNVPHYYLTVDVSLDSILALRSRLNEAVQGSDPDASGISLNDLLVKSATCAMKACPTANASWLEHSVRVYDHVDINIAVGTGDALYTPLVKNAGTKGLKTLSDEISSHVDAAASEEGVSAESCGMGTFTIINLGMYGVKSCAPIITEPQACALALGAAENRIVPNTDPESEEIYKESVMLTATLSCDHRVVDGAVGAQWLSAFKNHVENPESLLL